MAILFYSTLDRAIREWQSINDPDLVVVDGPEDNYTIISIEDAMEIQDVETQTELRVYGGRK